MEPRSEGREAADRPGRRRRGSPGALSAALRRSEEAAVQKRLNYGGGARAGEASAGARETWENVGSSEASAKQWKTRGLANVDGGGSRPPGRGDEAVPARQNT